MDISYLGHAGFKLKGAGVSVVMDPFGSSVGFEFSRTSADVVTVSHGHEDHNNVSAVSGTARRKKPFLIDKPGEYEVGGVSVFGISTYHDDQKGKERGKNIVFSVMLEEVTVAHLGDLGHELSDRQVAELNGVDVLLCPVGGHYTIGPKVAMKVIAAVEPSVLVPMHYRTGKHDKKVFSQVAPLEEFLKEFGGEAKKQEKLSITRASMPEEMELVVLG